MEKNAGGLGGCTRTCGRVCTVGGELCDFTTKSTNKSIYFGVIWRNDEFLRKR